MKYSILLTLALVLTSCAGKKVAPGEAKPTAPLSAPADSAGGQSHNPILPPGTTPSPSLDPNMIAKAEALRAEGMELLYSKDPLVKNEAKAKEKFEAAAKMGDPVSMDQLGGFYSSGIANTPKDCAKAISWFEKSAQGGYPLAMNNLAFMLSTCPNKKLRDAEKAEELVKFLYSANPSMLALLDTYSAVLAEQGNYSQAAKTLEVVMDLASLMDANPQKLDEMKVTLSEYQSKFSKEKPKSRSKKNGSKSKKSSGGSNAPFGLQGEYS